MGNHTENYFGNIPHPTLGILTDFGENFVGMKVPFSESEQSDLKYKNFAHAHVYVVQVHVPLSVVRVNCPLSMSISISMYVSMSMDMDMDTDTDIDMEFHGFRCRLSDTVRMPEC
jgi:hypothetical protein